MSEVRRLYRSPRDAMLGGVCAGLARYASLDATLVRLGTVILCFIPPLCPAVLIAYVVAWILVPRDPSEEEDMPEAFARREEAKERVVERAQSELGRVRRGRSGNGRVIFGAILVVGGLILLAEQFDLLDRWFSWFRFEDLWPLILVGLGLALLARGLSRPAEEPTPAGEPPAPEAGSPPPPPAPPSTPQP